jgi:hypothetical protein
MSHQPIAVQSVRDIQANGKRWLEEVLGQPLQESQKVFILAFTPGVLPSETLRREALAGLEATWEKVETHRHEQSISDAEFDATVDEAMKQVRPGNP